MNDYKICSKLSCRLFGIAQPIINFGRYLDHGKKRFRADCKECHNLLKKNYRSKNIDIERLRNNSYAKNRRLLKPEEVKLNKDRDYKKHKIKRQLASKNYYLNNKEKIINQNIIYEKQRLIVDFNFKLKKKISHSIRIKLNKNKKSVLKYLPYSIEELRLHLESKFESWMSWNNYGPYTANKWIDNDQSTWLWNLDHIIPHSTFKYTSMEDVNFKKCWSLENLRPYSAKQNFIDGILRIRH